MAAASFVVQRDPLFRLIYEAIDGKTSVPVAKLGSTIGLFRKTLSLAWLRRLHDHDPERCLSVVISTLLRLTEHLDASIRVISYSTLGALLLVVAPFDPSAFIRAFGNAAGQAPVSSRSSIAIINMFICLSRFVSPVERQSFIIAVPVLNHFKADVSDFLKHLPRVIPLMENLPLAFHECFMENLLVTCSKKLNSSFTGALVTLISLDKKNLLPRFIQFVKGEGMAAVVVSLGPSLIGDREIFGTLDEEGRELFLSCSLDEFDRRPPRFMEFEASCLTCASFLR